MKSSTIAIFTKSSTLPSGTKVLELALLSGSDANDKTRYLNGSFIVTRNSKGVDEVESALADSKEESILVKVEISNLFAEASKGTKGDTIFVNYKGLIETVSVYEKKSK